MDLIRDPAAVSFINRDVSPGTGTPGWPTNGNPAVPQPATDILAYHYGMMMGELFNPILTAGITPDDTNYTQLFQAILALAYFVDTGSVNALAASPRVAPVTSLPALSAIPDGFTVRVLPLHTTTSGAPTFAWNGGSAVTITNSLGAPLLPGIIRAGVPVELMKAGGASPTWWLLSSQAAPVAGQAFNFEFFQTSARTSMSGNSGNSYSVTLTPFSGSFEKQSATSTLIGLLTAPTFTPSSPGVGCSMVSLGVGAGSQAQPCSNNTATDSRGVSDILFVVTGVGAGAQAITLTYFYPALTNWTTILNPYSGDSNSFPSTTSTNLLIYEVGP